jgi:hypothetical protein
MREQEERGIEYYINSRVGKKEHREKEHPLDRKGFSRKAWLRDKKLEGKISLRRARRAKQLRRDRDI